jgi:hypothetical protein
MLRRPGVARYNVLFKLVIGSFWGEFLGEHLGRFEYAKGLSI